MDVVYLADYPEFADEVARRAFAVWERLYAEVGIDLPGLIALHRARAVKDRMPFTLIALHEGELVGAVGVKAEEASTRAGLSPWLAGLLVREDWRGHGVGRALVSAAERVAAGFGVATLYLSCELDNVAFYEKSGWRVRERLVSLGDEVAVMEKALG